MNLIVSILIGLAIGVMVELLLPGHTASELVLAILLGVAGALLARLVGERGGWFSSEEATKLSGGRDRPPALRCVLPQGQSPATVKAIAEDGKDGR
jgi:uncharacterized membrane protein YeaQ/YmgE (transglycosylase-associated protein family)